jgi:hypothetical protein
MGGAQSFSGTAASCLPGMLESFETPLPQTSCYRSPRPLIRDAFKLGLRIDVINQNTNHQASFRQSVPERFCIRALS